jgi:hypothetical protein
LCYASELPHGTVSSPVPQSFSALLGVKAQRIEMKAFDQIPAGERAADLRGVSGQTTSWVPPRQPNAGRWEADRRTLKHVVPGCPKANIGWEIRILAPKP